MSKAWKLRVIRLMTDDKFTFMDWEAMVSPDGLLAIHRPINDVPGYKITAASVGYSLCRCKTQIRAMAIAKELLRHYAVREALRLKDPLKMVEKFPPEARRWLFDTFKSEADPGPLVLTKEAK